MSVLEDAQFRAWDAYTDESTGGVDSDALKAAVRAALEFIRTPTPGMVAAAMATPGMKEVEGMIVAASVRQLSAPGLRWKERGEPPPMEQAWTAVVDYILGGGE